MDLAADLAEVDRLRTLAFPARPVRSGAVRSGPGYHLAGLATGADLAEDDGSLAAAEADDLGAHCQALVELLARRWGDPEPLDLTPFLVRLHTGGRVPPPLGLLCGLVPEVYGWRAEGRWIGLGVGQAGRQSPFQVVLAIGEPDVGPARGAA